MSDPKVAEITADALRTALQCDRPRCACRRGKNVHAPCHEDRRPSFGVDQFGDRVVFVCRAGCAQQRALEALRERGLWPTSRRPAPQEPLPPLEAARRRVLALARHQAWVRPGVTERYRRADLLRLMDHIIDGARRVATQLGPENSWTWELLDAAAGLERVRLLEDGDLVA